MIHAALYIYNVSIIAIQIKDYCNSNIGNFINFTVTPEMLANTLQIISLT